MTQPNGNFPGQIWLRQPNGSHLLVPDTPANRQVVNDIEMNASMSTMSPRGDYATVADFRQQYVKNLTPQGFRQFLQLHQCSPRHAITLELQATAEGLNVTGTALDPLKRTHIPLADDERAMTFQPGMTTESEEDFDEDDTSYPKVSDGDVDHVRVPGNTSFRRLQRAGIVSRSMSAEQFNARLARIGIGESDRLRKGVLASTTGFLTKPNGDTFSEHSDDWPMKGHLPPSRIANLTARREHTVREELAAVRAELNAQIARLEAHRAARRQAQT